jgi:hypothetical protein
MDNKDDDDENESLDSWGAPKNYSQVVAERTEFVTRTKSGKGVDSHASPIAARLITDIEDEPPKIGREHSFPSRAESSSRWALLSSLWVAVANTWSARSCTLCSYRIC